MHDRIKRIIEEKGLQASSFADKIQVSRGTISHILNGRTINGVRIYNDPSKDTIEKILITFPDISPSWFLRGEGPMYIRERVFIQPTSTSTSKPVQTDLFDEKKPVQSLEQSQGREYSQKNEDKTPENKRRVFRRCRCRKRQFRGTRRIPSPRLGVRPRRRGRDKAADAKNPRP